MTGRELEVLPLDEKAKVAKRLSAGRWHTDTHVSAWQLHSTSSALELVRARQHAHGARDEARCNLLRKGVHLRPQAAQARDVLDELQQNEVGEDAERQSRGTPSWSSRDDDNFCINFDCSMKSMSRINKLQPHAQSAAAKSSPGIRTSRGPSSRTSRSCRKCPRVDEVEHLPRRVNEADVSFTVGENSCTKVGA